MAMFRIQASSFVAGFAAASAIALYQLQTGVWSSHQDLGNKAERYCTQLEARIQHLEHVIGPSPSQLHPNEEVLVWSRNPNSDCNYKLFSLNIESN